MMIFLVRLDLRDRTYHMSRWREGCALRQRDHKWVAYKIKPWLRHNRIETDPPPDEFGPLGRSHLRINGTRITSRPDRDTIVNTS